jgi:hypothetical protein
MSASIEKRHEKLFFKAKYLHSELEEAEEIYEGYKDSFLKEVSTKQGPKKEKKDDLKECISEMDAGLESIFDDEIFDCQNNNLPKSFKKLYKKIMIKVHPDKLIFTEDDEKREKYSNICKKATSAAESFDWFKMIESAMELNIDISDISEEQTKWLENDCDKISKKILDIKNTYPWVWGRAGREQREFLVSKYLESLIV